MNTTKNNILIAKFMGYENNNPTKGFLKHPTIENRFDRQEFLDYHASWDWLMPVVKKISRLGIDHNEELFKQLWNGLSIVNIELLYIDTMNYIKWFNQQK